MDSPDFEMKMCYFGSEMDYPQHIVCLEISYPGLAVQLC